MILPWLSRNLTKQLIFKRYQSSYPTSSIEYVYGLSSVACALHARKRQVHKLYVQQRLDSDSISNIMSLCKQQEIPVACLDKGRLNSMTLNKPHQGVVLEASLRQTISIKGLTWKSTENDTSYTATSSPRLTFQKPQDRQPLWIALDQVQDPQNLGSIIRTAHFFDVDGLIVCSKNSAPLSAAVSKVSAGALEIMDVYTTHQLVKFLELSRHEGWQIIGAASAEATTSSKSNHDDDKIKNQLLPTILVFGNEGAGLRTNVKKCCDSLISIPGGGQVERQQQPYSGFVDSLNVGVAMGVLVSNLLSTSPASASFDRTITTRK